jgi:hypothetical protein
MIKRRAGIAAVFTAIVIAEFAALNLIFSPGYIWFYYVAFGMLWWPLVELVSPRRTPVGFALAGSAMTAVFLAVVNLQNSPGYPWFLNSLYLLAWWPLSAFFSSRRRFKALSLAGCVISMAYLVALNLVFSPRHPWFLYACYPLLWWPIVMYLGKKAGTLAFAAVCSAVTIAYYTALNVFVSPGYPWAIYPAYAVLWWPLAIYFARRKQWMGFSIAASVMSILFFIAANLVSSPHAIWAIYPIFAILWWPMSMLFAKTKNWLGYSVAGAALFSVFMVAVNLITSPGTPWAFYPIFAVLWWPMSMFFAKRRSWLGYSLAGALLFSAFILAVNLLTSPGTLWAIYPIFAVLWWPLSMYFFKYRKMKLAQ